MKLLLRALACSLLAGAAIPAVTHAHKPLFLETSTTRTVERGSDSYAAYGTFDGAGQTYSVRGPLRVGDPIVAQLLIPDAQPEAGMAPAALPRLALVRPDGTRVTIPPLETPTPFDEPITDTRYLTIADLTGTAEQAGTYTWTATSRSAGRFVLVLGKAERFGASDVVGLPLTIRKVRAWAADGAPAEARRGSTPAGADRTEAPRQPLAGETSSPEAARVLIRALLAATLVMAAAMALGLATRDNSFVDLFWGPTVLAAAGGALTAVPTLPNHAWLAVGLVAAWAARLSAHLAARKVRFRGEDPRYAAWREQWGRSWVLRSLLQVYLLQGLLATLAAAPVIVAALDPDPTAKAWLVAGALVWLAGMALELVADAQLARHRRRRAEGSEPNRLLASGLWSLSRHPNYLGEALLWWGIGITVLGTMYGPVGLLGPLLVTVLVRYVSGVPILERSWSQREGFAQWASQTPVFMPDIRQLLRRPRSH